MKYLRNFSTLFAFSFLVFFAGSSSCQAQEVVKEILVSVADLSQLKEDNKILLRNNENNLKELQKQKDLVQNLKIQLETQEKQCQELRNQLTLFKEDYQTQIKSLEETNESLKSISNDYKKELRRSKSQKLWYIATSAVLGILLIKECSK